MRILENQIRAALLDPDEEVRCTALCWYSEAFSRDSTVMPVVLDSIRQFGPAASWRMMREAQWLAQTPATVDGLIAALNRADDPPDVREDNFRFAAGLVLCRAPVELVAERLSVISRCPAFPEVLEKPLEDRVLLSRADWDHAVAALVRLGEKTYRYRRWTRIDILRADSIIEVLAGFKESRGQGVLALLERRKNHKLVAWLEPFLIRLAGRMGLTAAIPRLLRRLEGEGIRRSDDLALALVTTLARLGTDEVVDSLAATWSPSHRRATDADRLRLFACDVLERMRSDRCLGFLMDHISDNADRPPVRISTAHALLAQFERGAVAPVRRLIRETKVAGYARRLDLYYHLLAACRVMQESFPGFERRYEKAVAANWGSGRQVPRMADEYFDSGPWPNEQMKSILRPGDVVAGSKGIELLPYLWMVCGAFAFSIMGACAHGLGEVCDWQVVALARSIVPLCVAACLARSTGATLVLRGSRSLWLRSIAGSISLVSTFYAFTRLPISEVLTLTNLFPIWVAVLSWPLLKVIPAPDVWVAATAGIVGVALIQQPHVGETGHATTAACAALAASFCSAMAMIGLHRLKSMHTWAIVVHFSLVSLLFSGGAFLIFERSHAGAADWSLSTLAMLLCVGLSATVGQFFLTKAFTSGPPARVSVAGLTQVGFGMAFDALLWGKSFSLLTILGTILVVAPTGWLLWRRQEEESSAEALEEA